MKKIKRCHRYADRRSKGMISGKGSFTRRRVSGGRERIEEREREEKRVIGRKKPREKRERERERGK